MPRDVTLGELTLTGAPYAYTSAPVNA